MNYNNQPPQNGWYYDPYGNTQGGYPSNGYGVPVSVPAQNPFNPRLMNERQELKTFSRVAGLCVLGYLLVQNLLGVPIMLLPSLRQAYLTDVNLQSIFGILFSIIGVFMPFAIGAYFLKQRRSIDCAPLSMPQDKTLFILLIPAAFMLTIGANYLTGVFDTFAEQMGFSLEMDEPAVPTGVFGRIIYVIEIAVVPPLCEEFAARGVVMQPLRKYGDTFAILMSALVFAIMHGNLVQAPFAFIAGLILGYAVCKTNSLWTGIAIHCLNNGFSVLIEFLLQDVTDITTQNIIYYIILAVIILTGLVSLVAIGFRYAGQAKLVKSETVISGKKKTGAYILTLPMLLAIVSMLFITAQYVSYNGGK